MRQSVVGLALVAVLRGPIQNLFRVGRHHLKAVQYRFLRGRALAD